MPKALTEAEVRHIVAMAKGGVHVRDIAAAFGIAERTAWNAANGYRKGKPPPPASFAERPGCMLPDEFDEWQRFNLTQPHNQQASSPCDDCLPDFALEVRSKPLNLCDGHPGGVEEEPEPFRIGALWDDPGWRKAQEAQRRLQRTERLRRELPLRQEALRRQEQGESLRQIGDTMGLSRKKVWNLLQEVAA